MAFYHSIQNQYRGIIVKAMEEAKAQGKEASEKIEQNFAVFMAFRTGNLSEEALKAWLANDNQKRLDLTLDSKALGHAVEGWYQDYLVNKSVTPLPSPNHNPPFFLLLFQAESFNLYFFCP